MLLLSIFASHGFHGTTMAQISRESQYPLGTIYKYFPGKKQIYHDLVIERVNELGRILLEITGKKDTPLLDKLKDSLFAKAMFYKTNNEFVRIYISERSNIDAVMMPKLNERVNKMHEKMVTMFEKIFEQGKGEIFKPYPSREMAVLFTDIAHSVSWSSLFQDEDEKRLNRRLEMIFDMFINGVAIKNQ